MAAASAKILTNDQQGYKVDRLVFTGGQPATLNGAVEFGFVLPTDPAGSSDASWKLKKANIRVGTNTTHSDGVITLSIEKNDDGGTSALTTAPAISDDAGTGNRSTKAAATGITEAVVKTDADGEFDEGDLCFVTLSETGSGGTDPSDVFFCIEFERQQNFDPTV